VLAVIILIGVFFVGVEVFSAYLTDVTHQINSQQKYNETLNDKIETLQVEIENAKNLDVLSDQAGALGLKAATGKQVKRY
jgi:predicted PurR-regulated permease PerM